MINIYIYIYIVLSYDIIYIQFLTSMYTVDNVMYHGMNERQIAYAKDNDTGNWF